MAAGPVTVLNAALAKILSGVFDLDAGTFALVLTTQDQVLSASFTGTSGDALFSDLTDEVVGTGYTSGGQEMAGTTINLSGDAALVSTGPVLWSGAAFTAKYGVICRADETGDPTDILAFFDIETTDPAGRIAAGDFMVSFNDGLLDLERV